MKTLLKPIGFLVLTGILFIYTLSSYAVTAAASAANIPVPATSGGLNSTVVTPVSQPPVNKVTASQFGIDLPINLGIEYVQGTGTVLDGQFDTLFGEHWAGSVLAQYNSNLYRINGTLGALIGISNLFKVTVERLSEVLPFQFDSGNINQRVNQNAVGARYQAGFDTRWIQALNAGTYYAKADGVNLPNLNYVSGGLTYTNYRNIAGSTSGGGDVGVVTSLTRSTQLNANLYYDIVNYSTSLTSSSQYNSSGFGVSGSLAQLLGERIKLIASAEARKIYDSLQVSLAFLPKAFARYDMQLALGAGRFIPHTALPSSNSVGVQLGFSLEAAKVMNSAHYVLDNPAHPDLRQWATVPAVYMQQVLVVGEQQSSAALGTVEAPLQLGSISVSPAAGPTGTTVTISGSGFSGATAVKFGTDAATFTVVNDSTITATAPAGILGDKVDVAVVTPEGTQSLAKAYQYVLQLSTPTITSVSPTYGVSGTLITINGSAFSNGPNTVSYTPMGGGGPIPGGAVTTLSDIQATTQAPIGLSGGTTYNIQITNIGGTSAISAADQYTAEGTPSVTSFSPTVGSTAGGTSVEITGTNFIGTHAANGVQFGSGNNATSYTVNSSTSITATAPAHSAGGVSIIVTNDAGSGSSSTPFTYAVPPTVTDVSPNSGSVSGGTLVTITGTGFTGATEVDFGSTAASYSVKDDNHITASSPAGAVGTVDITVTAPSGLVSATSSADQFTYVGGSTSNPVTGTTNAVNNGLSIFGTNLLNPIAHGNSAENTAMPLNAISSISPSQGSRLGGEKIIIKGKNLNEVSKIYFGDTAVKNFSVINNSTLQVTAPPHSTGTVDVKVQMPEGSSTLTKGFSYH